MILNFILSQTDTRPMYLQIIEQIKLHISAGDWPQGYKLPSIRELAVATRVSVITIKRAYQELEREGVIVTRQGKGSFVSEAKALNNQLMLDKIDQHLDKAAGAARSIGWDAQQFGEAAKSKMAGMNIIEEEGKDE